MRIRTFCFALTVMLGWSQLALAADWITAPSYFSHDPDSGKRVTQYSPVGPFYIHPRADYKESGFVHEQSSIRVGGSASRMHVTREWGGTVRPYGEWQRPFRPYSVPYDQWGEPYGGLGGAIGPNGPWGVGFGTANPRGRVGGRRDFRYHDGRERRSNSPDIDRYHYREPSESGFDSDFDAKSRRSHDRTRADSIRKPRDESHVRGYRDGR